MITQTTNSAVWTDVQDALLARMGVPIARYDTNGRPLVDGRGRVVLRAASNEALSLAGCRYWDLVEIYLRRVGPAHLRDQLGSMPRSQLVALSLSRAKLAAYFRHLPPQGATLAQSTGDFPSLLADTLNKATSVLYAEARRTWRAWARRQLVSDFKQQDRVRINDFDDLPLVAPGDEVDFYKTTEAGREQYMLATYASGVKLTRQALLNDDLGLFASIPTAFVATASRVEDALAYGVLSTNAEMSDNVALFATAHANMITGALTTTTYGQARAKLARQTTTGGDVVDLVGSRLIVPPEATGAAESVLADSARAQRALDESPCLLVESPFLTNTSQWYLAADPRLQPSVEVAFLSNNPEPVVSDEYDFNTDGLRIKCRHDVAAAAVDHRPIVRGSGS